MSEEDLSTNHEYHNNDDRSDASSDSSPYHSDGEIIRCYDSESDVPIEPMAEAASSSFPYEKSCPKNIEHKVDSSKHWFFLDSVLKNISEDLYGKLDIISKNGWCCAASSIMPFVCDKETWKPNSVVLDVCCISPQKPLMILTFTDETHDDQSKIVTRYNVKLSRIITTYIKEHVGYFVDVMIGVMEKKHYSSSHAFTQRINELENTAATSSLPSCLYLDEKKFVTVKEVLFRMFSFNDISKETRREPDGGTTDIVLERYMGKEKKMLEEKKRTLEEKKRALEEKNRTLEENNRTLEEKNRTLEEKNRTLEEENKKLSDEKTALEYSLKKSAKGRDTLENQLKKLEVFYTDEAARDIKRGICDRVASQVETGEHLANVETESECNTIQRIKELVKERDTRPPNWSKEKYKHMFDDYFEEMRDSQGKTISLNFLMFGPTGVGKSTLCNGFRSLLNANEYVTDYYPVSGGMESEKKGFISAKIGPHWITDMGGIYETKNITNANIRAIASGNIPFVYSLSKDLEVLGPEGKTTKSPGNNDVQCVVIVVKAGDKFPDEIKRQINVILQLAQEKVVTYHVVVTHLDQLDDRFNDNNEFLSLLCEPVTVLQDQLQHLSEELCIPQTAVSFVRNYYNQQKTDQYTNFQLLHVLSLIKFKGLEQHRKTEASMQVRKNLRFRWNPFSKKREK